MLQCLLLVFASIPLLSLCEAHNPQTNDTKLEEISQKLDKLTELLGSRNDSSYSDLPLLDVGALGPSMPGTWIYRQSNKNGEVKVKGSKPVCIVESSNINLTIHGNPSQVRLYRASNVTVVIKDYTPLIHINEASHLTIKFSQGYDPSKTKIQSFGDNITIKDEIRGTSTRLDAACQHVLNVIDM